MTEAAPYQVYIVVLSIYEERGAGLRGFGWNSAIGAVYVDEGDAAAEVERVEAANSRTCAYYVIRDFVSHD